MIMSLRDGVLPSKQSPVTRGDCFVACARNDMPRARLALLREGGLSSPECSSLAPPARAGVRGVSKPQSATGEGVQKFCMNNVGYNDRGGSYGSSTSFNRVAPRCIFCIAAGPCWVCACDAGGRG